VGTTPVEGLLDLAQNLGIKLKPAQVEFEAYLFRHQISPGAIHFFRDMYGTSLHATEKMLEESGFGEWKGKRVKVTITEVVDD
jgi:hypothetical protein